MEDPKINVAVVIRRRLHRTRRRRKMVGHARSEFLDLTWRIERKITRLIALQLTNPGVQRDLLLSTILGHREMTFSVKSEILSEVHAALPIAGIDKATFDLVKKIREFRNKLAHSVLLPDSEGGAYSSIVMLVKGGKVMKEPLKYIELLQKRRQAEQLSDKLQQIIEQQKSKE